ncbi:hypothetical protein KPSA3_03949 [Pseudomonas syringae pv. actinidiae]|uniref:Uncharacterized protein n=1 Tax=Pseudomonas syringae pv. actinidiae TaxID=103796 RepID=A0AAN4TMA0_PSESF|nr:hypothetical protein KPSA3_03949 [Pseudomonas syringae pv. actinidiae]
MHHQTYSKSAKLMTVPARWSNRCANNHTVHPLNRLETQKIHK